MLPFDRKGYQPDPNYEYASGVTTTTPPSGGYDSAQDVFGNEDGAQVHLVFLYSHVMLRMKILTHMT